MVAGLSTGAHNQIAGGGFEWDVHIGRPGRDNERGRLELFLQKVHDGAWISQQEVTILVGLSLFALQERARRASVNPHSWQGLAVM